MGRLEIREGEEIFDLQCLQRNVYVRIWLSNEGVFSPSCKEKLRKVSFWGHRCHDWAVVGMEEILKEWHGKFFECKRLVEEEEKKNAETEPYKSKYKAKEMLLELREDLRKEAEKRTGTEGHPVRVALAATLGQLGSVCLETEELPKAEEYLMEALRSMEEEAHPDCILVSLQVRNQLGFLWSQRSEAETAKKWLEEAEKLYVDFKSGDEKVARWFSEAFEEGSREANKELETVHTMTKFYLAQVYGMLKDLLKSAVYCHETLRRELLQEYEPIDWALNSATLSQFFMERLLFKQARHHLAASSYMLDTVEENLKSAEESEEKEAKKEELRHRSADVSRCWAKYGIFLLEHSKNRSSGGGGEEAPEKNEDLEKLWFDGLELSMYEKEMTDTAVVAFEDAREVFLVTQRHLNRAKEYYTLEDRASDHVQIVQDHSQLFRHLTAFEPDEDRQSKMMKKRIDMLEAVLKELNPQYYMDMCRQLWFELGETYHDMMQIKFQKVKESTDAPAPQALKKINALAEASLKNFNAFLDSIRDKKTKELPDPLPEELLGPALVAHFYLGRLYYKYITPDRRKQVENTTKAYESFKYLVDTCETSERARSVVGEELNISREMMTLLQMKVLQL